MSRYQKNESGLFHNDNEQPVQEKRTIVIDDKTYKIKELPIKIGLEMLEDLTKRFLPSIGSILDLTQHDQYDGSPKPFSEAFSNLSKNLDGNTMYLYSVDLFDGATVDGEPLDIEDFAANYGVWRKLFLFALQENFSSFFVDGWATTISEKLKGMLNQNLKEEYTPPEQTE